MADRIEYQGNPLPTGLPGFGGATVETVVLPGINTVVTPLAFGPTVEAINATPPNPTPPEGNDPNNPTYNVVDPGVAPSAISGGSNSFCVQCETEENVGDFPILTGIRKQTPCVDCSGGAQTIKRYISSPAATAEYGVYWSPPGTLRGYTSAEEEELQQWKITPNSVYLTNDAGYYDYSPKEVTVCVDGEPKTWYILAYQVP